MGQPAEREYDGLLLEWLHGLMWPCRPQLDENPLDVTLLELFVWFTMVTRKLSPIAIAVGTGHRFDTFDSLEAKQVPDTSMDMIARFVARVRALESALGSDFFLATEVVGISRLGSLGVGRRLDARPLLCNVPLWVPVVLEWARQVGWQHVFTPGPPATAYRSRHGLICIVSLYLQQVEVF